MSSQQILFIEEGKKPRLITDSELEEIKSKNPSCIKLVSENEKFKVYKRLSLREVTKSEKKIKQVANKVVFISPTMDRNDIETTCKKIQNILNKANVKILIEARKRKGRVKKLQDLNQRIEKIETILVEYFGKALRKVKNNHYLINKSASSSNG